MSLFRSITCIVILLIIDQMIKVYVKTNFMYGEIDQINVTNWCKILLIENEGMAWGARIPGEYGKLILTIFRLLAIGGIGYWLYHSSQRYVSVLLMVSITLIFAGAVGNLIDSMFYGVIFDDSYGKYAQLFADQPYGTLFHGKVVDMFYFPFIKDYPMPTWVPFIGGENFTFFNAIFNMADVYISTGVGILIVFNKKAFAPDLPPYLRNNLNNK
jgi:signal peptidase II